MRFFPVILRVADQRIVVSGGGEAAVAKLRLLLKTEARIEVYATEIDPVILRLGRGGAAHGSPGVPFNAVDVARARLVYGRTTRRSRMRGLRGSRRMRACSTTSSTNLEGSAFLTPALVDRDPVVVAIGTEGAAPVLARKVKAHLEEKLPAALGGAREGGGGVPSAGRGAAQGARAAGRSGARSSPTPRPGAAPEAGALDRLLAEHLGEAPKKGRVLFVGAGPAIRMT